MEFLYILLGFVVGAVVGFFVTRYIFKKQLKDNPPINEKMIRQMFISMGQKPSEARIQQVLRSMGVEPTNKNKNK